MCGRLNVSRAKSSNDIHRQYDGQCQAADFDPKYEESTTNHLRRTIREKDKQNQQLEEKLAQAIQAEEDITAESNTTKP